MSRPYRKKYYSQILSVIQLDSRIAHPVIQSRLTVSYLHNKLTMIHQDVTLV